MNFRDIWKAFKGKSTPETERIHFFAREKFDSVATIQYETQKLWQCMDAATIDRSNLTVIAHQHFHTR